MSESPRGHVYSFFFYSTVFVVLSCIAVYLDTITYKDTMVSTWQANKVCVLQNMYSAHIYSLTSYCISCNLPLFIP